MTDITTQTDETTEPVLLNQYIFNKVIQDVNDSLKMNKIRCSVCLDSFQIRKKLIVCKKCIKIFDYDCGKGAGSKCPVCRYSGDCWYTLCGSGHDIYNIVNACLTVKEQIRHLTEFNDTPLNMVPTLETEYKGITKKIKDTFEAIKDNECVSKIVKSNMELANYLMLKCNEIDTTHKNIMKQEEDILDRQKVIIKHQFELEARHQEINRQSEILDGCKRALHASVDQIEKNVNVEIKQFKDTGNVKQLIKI